jgi:hypothetical protein
MMADAKKKKELQKARVLRDEKRREAKAEHASKQAAARAAIAAKMAWYKSLLEATVREVSSNTTHELASINDTEFKQPPFIPLGWGHEDYTSEAEVAAAKSKSKRLRERLASQHKAAMEEMDDADRRINDKAQDFAAKPPPAKKARKHDDDDDDDDDDEDNIDDEEEDEEEKQEKKKNSNKQKLEKKKNTKNKN